jgi:hypothetical protein
MSGADTGKPERAPYVPPYFRHLDVEESGGGTVAFLFETLAGGLLSS